MPVVKIIWVIIVVSLFIILADAFIPTVQACGQAQYRAPSSTMAAWGQHKIDERVALTELTSVYRGDRVSAKQYFDMFEPAPFASAPVYPRWGGALTSAGSSNQGKKGSPPGQEKKKGKEK